MRKTTKLRELLFSRELTFLMEAHNAISAKIAEEAGFAGLWGSGLTMSASSGRRDNNELSWTQVLENLEYISDATQIPLLLDGDTGYGNFNNFRLLVKKLESRNIAGVCIEDKLFPKTNSFINGETQVLADIDEFCGKIKAGKDSQADDHFVIVARVESFIVGLGLADALRRAEAYRQAGADAILIHSKLSTPNEVLTFKKEWADRCPVIIVPTKYYSTPTEVFEKAGFSTVIWANHLLRSSVMAMKEAARLLHTEKSIVNLEEKIATVSELFRLQGASELEDAEKKYLPKEPKTTSALILAATQGAELRPFTDKLPKALLRLGNKSILERQIEAFQSISVRNVHVVRGFEKDQFNIPEIRYVDNSNFESTREVYSMELGLRGIDGAVFVSYGDIVFHKYLPMMLTESEADISLAVNPNWEESLNSSRYAEYVKCDKTFSKYEILEKVKLERVSSNREIDEKNQIDGEWMGIMKISERALGTVKDTLEALKESGKLEQARMKDFINLLVEKGLDLRVRYVRDLWFDVDEVSDYLKASQHFQSII